MNTETQMQFSDHDETEELPNESEDFYKALFSSLSSGDCDRFTSFCNCPSDPTKLHERIGVFRLSDFYGYHYAFARKKTSESGEKMSVTFLKTARKLNEHLSPAYFEFFSAPDRLAEDEVSSFSFSSSANGQSDMRFFDFRKEYTDVSQLIRKVLSDIDGDPVFYGNAITLSCQGESEDENGDFLLRFSSSALICVVYSLLGAFIEATVSHRISIQLCAHEAGAEIVLRTNTIPDMRKDMNGVSDLTAVSAFAEYSEPLTAFAEAISENHSFAPSVRYSAEDGTLSVTLFIGSDRSCEGEFRFREPYSDLDSVLGKVKALYRLVSVKWASSLYQEKQRQEENGDFSLPPFGSKHDDDHNEQ